MGRPSLDFTVVSWHDEVFVEEVCIFGTGPDGNPVKHAEFFAEGDMDVRSIAETVAKMNNNAVRGD